MNLYGDQATIERVLTNYRTWAVVGLSENPGRASHRVAAFLQSRDFQIIPVNPVAGQILGETAYPDLASIPEPVDVVDIFRRSSRAGAHVDEAIAIGAKAVWLQLDVIDEKAAARARTAGLDVIMDRCPAIEYPRLQRQSGLQ
ncbi:MAG: CoA-binding protein [Acidimicrobiia bacterium]|nr:CoA-binding protein [Acidimicrobiia bacterium]MDH3398180.1 CoA-binding protein [Acidimicrobiia bacterium]